MIGRGSAGAAQLFGIAPVALTLALLCSVELTERSAVAHLAGGWAAGRAEIFCLSKGGDRTVRRVRPKKCTHFGPNGSFGGGVNLAKLRWQHWGSRKATARGIERGFHLPPSHIPVRVTAYRKRAGCDGSRAYTRLKAMSRYGTTRVRFGLCAEGA
jgi:hypothetical protein